MPEDANALAARRVGTTLKEKYRLERLLGVGGMAAVYEGTHRNGNRVAVKMLHPHLSLEKDLRGRFLREGYVANKVQHRGAVKVLDDDVAEDGAVFLVMELLEGETLDARWKKAGNRLPHREVAQLAHQLLDGLASAHAKGIVHRDLKPENLFLTTEGIVKVLDFGIARLREASAGLDAATRTGRMMGTPAFMPPEQALGRTREVDAQTDIWAVGATMFTLMSGRLVHDAETVEELLVYTASRPARSLATVAPDVPAPIVAVVDRALAYAKADRWASAEAMEAALEDAYAAAYGEAMPSARATRTSLDAAAFARTAYASDPQVSPHVAPRPLGPTTAAPDAAWYGGGTPQQTVPLGVPAGVPAVAPQVAAPRGISTTAGVDASSNEEAPVVPKRSSGLVIAASLVGVLGIGAVAAVAINAKSGSSGAAAPPPSTSTVIAASAAPSPEPSPPAPPAPSASASSSATVVARTPPAKGGGLLAPRPAPSVAPPKPGPTPPTQPTRSIYDP